jgi:S-adenosylmethionine:tRNA ribosyltransferase-isomerase
MPNVLPINDFIYALPEDRIAHAPLENRDESKLLVYQKGEIHHTRFRSLSEHIPSNATLYFNDTKVIPARIHFIKDTGAIIEVFLLNPLEPSVIMAEAMKATGSCAWHCTIGNAKRWKDSAVLKREAEGATVEAVLKNREEGVVEFRWSPGNLSFAEIISKTGLTPLPPYIKRKASPEDFHRYQTIYSHHEGAVAAPTAGLHFTDNVLKNLDRKGVTREFLTLHVSAGTFQPVKTENALEHPMHQEQMVIQAKTLDALLNDTFTLPVGTTSMRTLESLYWFGVKLIHNRVNEFYVDQHDPYRTYPSIPSKRESLEAVKAYLNGREYLTGHTSIYIHPGYTFRVCRGLITNFHLPGSTLMLLVAAFVGDDWKRIYEEALTNEYRFLSYGDSSLLLP